MGEWPLVPLNCQTPSLLFAFRMTDSGFREGLSKVNKTAGGRELL